MITRWRAAIPRDAGGACSPTIPIYCGSEITGSTVSALARRESYNCAGARDDTGGEVTYRFVSPVRGSVTFALTSYVADLDLLVVGSTATGTCDPTSCLGASQQNGISPTTFPNLVDSVSRTVAKGDPLHVVVDGFAGAAGGYKLQVTCTKQ
jgi:hypothetical protein